MPPEPAPTRDELYSRLLHHQIAWKEHTANVGEQGATPEAAGRWYFPQRRWTENVLPHFRAEVLAHLQAVGIPHGTAVQHVLSTQVFTWNLFAPFLAHPEKLTEWFCDREGEEVVRVELEVAGRGNPFAEPGERGGKRTSASAGIWVRTPRGVEITLVDVRLTEPGFGRCSKGATHGGMCESGGRQLVAGGGGGCPLTMPPASRTYWKLLNELKPLRLGVLQQPGPCPFREHGYRLMRLQVLAAALAADPAEELVDARFAVLLHDGNQRARAALDTWLPTGQSLPWRDVVRRPLTFEVLGALDLLKAYLDDPDLGEWARGMKARYYPPQAMLAGLSPLVRRPRQRPATVEPVAPPDSPRPHGRGTAGAASVDDAPVRPAPVRDGHRAALRWLAGPDFAALKALHDRVLGPAILSYRCTDQGVVQMSLDPSAPCSVGFRVADDDDAHVLPPDSPLPSEADLASRLHAHREWLKTVARGSTEERAVAAWLRRALFDGLRAPGLDPAWRVLTTEWRLVDDRGAAQKLDAVLVNVLTGAVGLVEAKDNPRRQTEAVGQVETYAKLWARDAAELAPFFGQLAAALWSLYGVADAPAPTVTDDAPELFVAWPDTKLGLKLVSVDEL